jgi:putative pyoverdin transport system ATP-binding/permease protein
MKLLKFLLKNSRDIRHSRSIVVAAVGAGLVGGLVNTTLLALVNAALNRRGPTPASAFLLFAALCVMLPVVRYFSELMLIRLAADASLNLRMKLSRRILSTPLRQLEELGAHRLLATLTEDIPSITGALTNVPLVCLNAAVVAGCLIYVGWLSWAVLLWLLAAMAFGLLTYQLPVMSAVYHFQQARELSDSLMRHFRSLIDGAKELKLHAARREDFLGKALQPTADALRLHQVTGSALYVAARGWGQALVFVLVGLLVFCGGRLFNADAQTVSGYAIVLLYMMAPLEVILNTLPVFSRAKVAVAKVERVGLAFADGKNASAAPPAPAAWRRLELAGVTHSYYREREDSRFVLGPVSLDFRPGELVFIAGGNGSGKTTLAKLITGLYAPEDGEVRLDGEPVTEAAREQYRQMFSVVFSDFHLFESLLGLDAAGLDARARFYLARLQLEHKVRVEGGVLSTTELSQGQRKRLALLTAYLEDRPVYIFDEWAADQDPVFKEIFYLDLLPGLKARGKTVIVISHDSHYYHVADRLIKLEYGKVEYDRALPGVPAPDAAETPYALRN